MDQNVHRSNPRKIWVKKITQIFLGFTKKITHEWQRLIAYSKFKRMIHLQLQGLVVGRKSCGQARGIFYALFLLLICS